jgi:hypothetical protein
MTKTNIAPNQNRSDPAEDDMLPDYNFSQGIRGKHAHRVGKPYCVKISNSDGTETIQHFDSSSNLTTSLDEIGVIRQNTIS